MGRHSTTYALDSTWRSLLKDLGVSSANVLVRAGLPEGLLNRLAVRLEAVDFHRFWEGIDAELGDPLLPLKLCRAIRSESFSPLLFAALCSPYLLVAAQRIARYKVLMAPMRLEVCESANQVAMEFVWSEEGSKPPVSLVLTELLFVVALARTGTREQVQPLSVITTEPPTEQVEYADFLGGRIQKGNGHRVIFSREDAFRPFLTANEGLWAAFEPELQTRLSQLDAAVTVGQLVRSALLEALPGGGVKMDSVAQRLGMSRRSLQRHLDAEGLTYKDLLQVTRRDLALHYLLKTDLPVAEIAFLLGFEETNSFFRAFRGWSGNTPQHFRRSSLHPKFSIQPSIERVGTQIG